MLHGHRARIHQRHHPRWLPVLWVHGARHRADGARIVTRKKPSAPPALSALQVEELPIDAIHEYANNSRMHTVEQIELIARSITEYGWTNPILIDADSEIIAGHARLQAAHSLGMATVPTIRLGHLTPTQKRALVIADNKIAITGTQWDFTLLKVELAELKLEGFDLGLTGFDGTELSALFGGDPDGGLTDPDETPSVPSDPTTEPGDIWIMGRHRVMCGDSTNPQHVDALMAGAKADLCFTSPPYGQQRDYKAAIGDWDALMQGVFSILPVKHEAQVLVNLGMIHRDGEWVPYWDGWVGWMRDAGWRRFGWYVWDQGPGLPGDWNGRLAPSHEWIFHFNRVAERARKTKDKELSSIGRQRTGGTMRAKDGSKPHAVPKATTLDPHKIADSVVRVNRQNRSVGSGMDHPAVFPVDLVSEMLTAFSDPDDTVYEPFCGSGTQLISAQKNGRSAYGMEIAPAYTDVSVLRWQAFSGQTATLEGDGRTFAEITAARAKVPA
jgi:DNA modification methylase